MRTPINFALPLTLCVGAAAIGCGDEGDFRPRLEDAVDDANVSLSQAIEVAEEEAQGTPVEAELELNVVADDVYEVEVIDAERNRQTEVEIDPQDGSVEDVETSDADDGEIQDAAIISRAALSLREAVEQAESEVDADAYEADIDDGVYDIDLFGRNDDLIEVRISPTDGAVLDVDGLDGDAADIIDRDAG